ncbi:hypothetical protein DDIC_07995 [Desulfovibrio desulfuricans]|uniref:Trigger factor n=1 Tax=Desulfovibrio desulfuricans TaxID=876 RepID=A0A4P7UHP4_DESDE|nr:trigger factor [Desulfovibrio desulfuricans]QCC85815.1 hypothetical protein DDIC_07995 [Desulfovibrio desulfuricans]
MQRIFSIANDIQVHLSITVPFEELNSFLQQAQEELREDLPSTFDVTSACDRDDFWEPVAAKATSIMISTLVDRILKEEGRHPISRPRPINLPRLSYGHEYTFEIEIEVLPIIAFPENFSDIRLTVHEPEFSSEKFYKAVERLMVPITTVTKVTEIRFPQPGDIVDLRVNGHIDGKSVPGLTNRDIKILINAIPVEHNLGEVEQHVKKIHVGEQVEYTMRCPADYPDPLVRGKDVQLTVLLKALYQRELPKLTDSAAVRLGYKSAVALKTQAFMHVMNESSRLHTVEAKNRLMQLLLDGVEIPIPESLQQMFLAEYIKNVRAFFGTGTSAPEAKEHIRSALRAASQEGIPIAKENARRHVYLLAYAYAHDITVSQQDLAKSIREMAHRTGSTEEMLRGKVFASDMGDTLTESLMAEKALNLIFTSAQKVVVDQAGKVIPPHGKKDQGMGPKIP